MAQFESADVLGRFLQGYDQGIEQKQQSRLMDMRQQAFDAEQSAATQKQAGEDRDRQLATLQQVSSLYPSAPDMLKPHLYGQIVDLAEGVGFAPKGQLPRQLTPETEPKFQQFLQSFAGLGKQPQEQFTLAPGSARYDASGRVVATQPFAPQKPEYVLSPDGTQWLPKPMGMPQQTPQDAPSAAGPMMGQAFYDEIGKLISPYGATIGSTNGGEHNPGSLHYDGRALDIPLGASATDAVRANADRIIADLSGKGYKVRDERTRPDGQKVWGGPHLHVEAPAPAQSPAGGGAIPIPGARPRESEETYSQPQVVTNPQTGKQELVQFGNRGGRRVVTDYSPGPTDRDAKPPTEGERKAATLLSRLEFSENQLREAVKADKSAASPSLSASVAGSIPFVGEQARNFANSSARQRVEAAQLDILDAALTLGTGAAYTREQLEGYRKSYFPQIGDSDATIKDKEARLQNVIASARIAAGRAAPDAAASGGSAGSSSNGWSIKVKP